MALYLFIITLGGCLIAAIHAVCFGAWGLCFAVTFSGIVLEILIDGITAAGCRLLPKKCVPYEAKIFAVGAKEKRFYERLKIRKWKDRIPEIGHLTGFRKNKIADPNSLEYVERFLLEIRYGQVVHFVSLFSGFLLCFALFFPVVRLSVVLPICIVNFFLNLLPIFTLRYNGYKLNVLYQANKKRSLR